MGIELKVTVHKADNLLNVEGGGMLKSKDRKSDPYAVVIHGGFSFYYFMLLLFA